MSRSLIQMVAVVTMAAVAAAIGLSSALGIVSTEDPPGGCGSPGLLSNASFEGGGSGSSAGWTNTNISTTYPTDGSYYGWVQGGRMRQDYSGVAPGETFELTIWAGAHQPSNGQTVGFEFRDSSGSVIGSPTSASITATVPTMGRIDLGPVVAPAGAASVRVFAEEVTGNYFAKVDCAYLTKSTYDLALRKVYVSDNSADGNSTDGSVEAGDSITWAITVFNQGTAAASNIDVTDQLPSELSITSENVSMVNATNGGASTSLSRSGADITISSLPAGDSVTFEVTTLLSSSFTGSSSDNWAEISSDDGNDIDSTPDTSNGNQAGETNYVDDEIDQDGTNGGDEDDHDIASVTVTTPELFELGDFVWEDANNNGVFDAGELPLDAIWVELYSDLDNDGVADDTNNDGSITVADAIATTGTDPAGNYLFEDLTAGDYLVAIPAMEWDSGQPLEGYASSTGAPGGDNGDNGIDPAAIGDTVWSSPATVGDPDNDLTVDFGFYPLEFDLALIKQLDDDSNTRTVAPGNTVTFTLTVTNQGDIDATQIAIVDYVPTGLTLNDSNWTYDSTNGTATLNNPIASLPAGGGAASTTTVDITFSVDTSATGSLHNFAEIAGALDGAGDPTTDVDSTPDTDAGNDTAPSAGGDATDDEIDEDGLAGEDEDDHDVASLDISAVYDLTLIKTLGSQAATVDSTATFVTFDITVANQGAADASDIVVTDYVPTGLEIDHVATALGLPAGVIDNSDNTFTITSLTAVGTATDEITFTVHLTPIAPETDLSAFVGSTIINGAEISTDDGNDIDSTPDTSDTDDIIDGPNSHNTVDYDPDADNNLNEATPDDEDDHDREQITVTEYDLALAKIYLSDTSADGNSADGSVAPGNSITWEITVYNQGNIDALGTVITDQLPAELSITGDNVGTVTATNAGTPVVLSRSGSDITIDSLPAEDDVTFEITTLLSSTFTGSSSDNWAEISSDDGNDIDSTPDTTNGNDGSQGPGEDPTQNHVDNETEEDGTNGGDEDDHDIASVTVSNVTSYSLGNQVWEDSNNNGLIETGEPLLANIWVELYQDADADGIADDLNSDGTIDVNDVYPSTGTNGAGGQATTDTSGLYLFDGLPAGNYLVAIPSMEWDTGQPLVGYQSSTGNTADDTDNNDNGIDPTTVGDTVWSETVILGNTEPLAENPDNDPTTPDANENLTIDFGFYKSFDLALIKQLDDNTNARTVAPGATVTFTLTVTNQGNIDATQIAIVDYVPAGLTLNDTDWTYDTTTGTATLNTPIAALAANGGAASTTTVDITFTVDTTATSPLHNFAEISAALDSAGGTITDVDSTPDTTDTNDTAPTTGGDTTDDEINENGKDAGDEDDHDVATLTITAASDYDLALAKVITGVDPATGQVTYEITVRNQGQTDSGAFTVTDELPLGTTFVSADNAGTETAGIVTWNLGTTTALPANGDTIVLTLVVAVNDLSQMPFTNTAEISSDSGIDDDSSPDTTLTGVGSDTLVDITDPADLATDTNSSVTDEDDHDIATVEFYELGNQLWFDTDNSGTFDPGEATVPAGVTVNLLDSTGTQVATTTTDASGQYFFSYLLAGDYTVEIPATEFAAGAALENWVPSSGSAISSDPDDDTENNSDGIPQTGGSVLSGTVTIGATEPLAEDDNSPTSTPDDHSNLTVDFGFYQPYDLALTKVYTSDNSSDALAADGTIAPGDEVTYAITVTNQGAAGAASVTLTDYVPTGWTLASASSTLWTSAGTDVFDTILTGAQLDSGTATDTAPNVLDPGDSITIDIVLVAPTDATAGSFTNWAEISADDGDDIDSAPDATNDTTTESPTDNTIDDAAGTGLNSTTNDGDNDGFIDEDDHDPADVLVQVPVYELGDLVWEDTNNDGVVDPGEDPIENVWVELWMDANGDGAPDDLNSDGVVNGADMVATTGTDALGMYSFPNLIAGTYLVGIPAMEWDPGQPLENFESSTGNTTGNDTDNGIDPASVGDTVWSSPVPIGSPGDDLTVDFGFHQPPFYDLAIVKTVVAPTTPVSVGDIATWTITVRNQGTEPSGAFEITDLLGAGQSYVSDTSGVAPVSGTVGLTWSFGAASELQPNTDLTFDIVTEITDATMPLYRNDIEITADSGDDIDSDPAVLGNADDALTGWSQTSAVENHNDETTDTDGTNDEHDDHDAESFPNVPVYELGDLVWEDTNNNGVVDPGEQPIPNVWVELYSDTDNDGIADDTNADGVIDINDALATTGTDATGVYSFPGLVSGDYLVAIPAMEWDPNQPLENFESSTGNTTGDNTDNGVDPTTVGDTVWSTTVPIGTPGDDLTVDFGFHQPPSYSIGNQVWEDTDDDGLIDAGEPLLANIWVELYEDADADGLADDINGDGLIDINDAVATDGTDTSGLYLFDGLAAGSYLVAIPAMEWDAGQPLVGYRSSTGATAGDSDNDDNGIDPTTVGDTVWSETIVLDNNEPTGETPDNDPATPDENENLTVDFGFHKLTYSIGNQVWLDPNNNGVIDTGETFLPNIWVDLWADNDTDGLPDDINGDGVINGFDMLASDTTDSAGLYLFDGLDAGSYLVAIPSMDWDTGEPLVGYESSTGAGTSDDDTDNDDNGVDPATIGNTVWSTTITLDSAEPLAEDPDNDPVTPDTNENLTIDFGFFQTPVPATITLKKYVENQSDLAGYDATDDATLGQDAPTLADAVVIDYTGTAVYRITVSNPGPVTLGNVLVTDDHCAPLSRIDAGDNDTLDLLAVGERWTYECSIANVTHGHENIASTTATPTDENGQPLADLDPVSDSDNAWTDPARLIQDFFINKELIGDAVAGEPITWDISITNLGPDPAWGPITVVDDLPDGFVGIAGSGAGFTCSFSGPDNRRLSCLRDQTIAVNETLVFQLTASTQSIAPGGDFRNEVYILTGGAGNPIPDPENSGTGPNAGPLGSSENPYPLMDTDADGVGDSPALVDTDGDGVGDMPVLIDTDGDGVGDTPGGDVWNPALDDPDPTNNYSFSSFTLDGPTTTTTTAPGGTTTTTAGPNGGTTTTTVGQGGATTTTTTAGQGGGTTSTTAGQGGNTTSTTAGQGGNTTSTTAGQGGNTTSTTAGQGGNTTSTTAGQGGNTTSTTAGQGGNTTSTTAGQGGNTTPTTAGQGGNTTSTTAGQGGNTTSTTAGQGGNTTSTTAGQGGNTTSTTAGQGGNTTSTTAGQGGNTTSTTAVGGGSNNGNNGQVASTNNTPGEPVTVDPPTQIAGVAIDPDTVQLVDPATGVAGETVVVPGQGTWDIEPDGDIVFSPFPGFIANPTPVAFTADQAGSGIEAEGSVVVTFANDPANSRPGFESPGHAAGSPAIVSLPVSIEGMSVDQSSVELIDPVTGIPAQSVVVAGQGTWDVLGDGTVRFTPVAGFTGDPTPLDFQARVAGESRIVNGALALRFAASSGGKLPFTGAGTAGLMLFALAFMAAGFAYRSGGSTRLRRT